MKENLLSMIKDRTARIGVIGMGYVGLPLAVSLAEAGFTVVGIDVDERKVSSLLAGKSYIEDVPSSQLAPLVEAGKLTASADYAAVADVQAISICVPTPLRKTRDPDISYIIDATERIAKYMQLGTLIVLESTTYPGTTDEIITPRLSAKGGIVGENFFVAFSPERIDPGRTDYTIRTTPKVIGGTTEACSEIAGALYGTIVDEPVLVTGTATAEMVKLLENTFRAVNIGLVNEMAIMCDKLGVNVWEVVRAAATKPYGFMPFYPGPGLGGHCIPVDPHYLSWKLRTLNYTARFIELAAEVNRSMPDYVVGKIAEALNQERKAINGSKILVLGVAYKPNVSDVRESPALDIIHLLQERGADVVYNDPHVPSLTHEGIALESAELSDTMLQQADCTVIITDHNEYNWSHIIAEAAIIVDTRNALMGAEHSNLVRL